MEFDQLTPIILALVGSAGLWGYLSQKAKQNHERMLKHESKNAEFNDTLKEQVDSLNTKVDRLLTEKEELLNAIADLKADLAAAKATISHLEAIVRLK